VVGKPERIEAETEKEDSVRCRKYFYDTGIDTAFRVEDLCAKKEENTGI
jgi:hypothetical protein